MEDGVEFSGRSVEDAIVQAERALGVARSELDIAVITPGSRGVFGIGAEPARIRAHRPAVEEAAPAFPTVEEQTETIQGDVVAPPSNGFYGRDEPEIAADHVIDDEETDEFAGMGEEEERTASPLSPESSRDLAEEGREVLRELLDVMGFEADVTVRSTSNPIMLAITGDNLGVLIGRRGDNLAALQFMVNLILSKNRRQWPRVVVDVENYRERREESLRSLADRIAQRVRRNGKAFTLEAMPAGDRRIIHLTLRDVRDVETYSIGEGPARRVVVAPKRIARGEATRASS